MKKSTGITLIALIITVIVLLILAGITVNLVLSQDGIINRAQQAGIEHEKAQLKEELEVAILDIQTSKLTQGKTMIRDDLKELEQKGAIIESTGIPAKGKYKNYFFEVDEDYKVTIVEQIRIENYVTNINLNETKIILKIGDTAKLECEVFPENATIKEVNWTSSNEGIATVDSTGKITAVSEGKTIIKVMAIDGSGINATCEVEVIGAIMSLYNYGDKGTSYSSGWNYIGGRYYNSGSGPSYARHNENNIEMYNGGYIGTVLNENYLEKYKYLCIKSTSEVTRNGWTIFGIMCAENFDNYADSYAWGGISSYNFVGQNDFTTWKEKIHYVDLTQNLANKTKYLAIQFTEGRDGYIYQIYLTDTIPE